MMRKPLLVANWKLHKNRADAREFVAALLRRLSNEELLEVEIAIAPAFPALESVAIGLADSPIQLAAQNVSPEPSGAFTGEVSAQMLTDVGCRFCIVGHSERRTLFGETDAVVAAKARALLDSSLRPIICIGETLMEREAEKTTQKIGEQLEKSLPETSAPEIAELVVAYEPIWAIGTGLTATPGQAQAVHLFIRDRLKDRFGESGAKIQIQYGGSVNPSNVSALMAEPDIDGALIGGASLDPMSFAQIISHSITENNRS